MIPAPVWRVYRSGLVEQLERPNRNFRVRTSRSTFQPSGVSATWWEGALRASLKGWLHTGAPSLPRAPAP